MDTNENEGVASEYKQEGSESSFLKGADFDKEGLVVEVVGMEKFVPSDPKYGIKNTYGAGGVVTKENWFIKQGILEEGQSFKYSFIVDGVEKAFDNSSLSFYFTFTNLNPSRGDKILIKRNLISQTNVEWTVVAQ
jgi:hypothetical protein